MEIQGLNCSLEHTGKADEWSQLAGERSPIFFKEFVVVEEVTTEVRAMVCLLQSTTLEAISLGGHGGWWWLVW